MTKNEMFALISNATPDALTAVFGDHAADAQELATHVLEMDAAAKLRQKEKRAEAGETDTHRENREVWLPQMMAVLTADPQPAAAIAEAMGVKASKIAAIAKVGVELGQVVVSDVKVPKKGSCKAYAKA